MAGSNDSPAQPERPGLLIVVPRLTPVLQGPRQVAAALVSSTCLRHATTHHRRNALPLYFYKSGSSVPPVEAEGEGALAPSGFWLLVSSLNALTMPPIDLPQGTLDLLILKALSLQAMHGWAISERLHQVSRTTLQVPQGSLYPALHRLERRGLIKAEWGASDNNRKAKYYDLTRAGRKQLAAETDAWDKLTTAVALVLKQA